MAVFDVTKEQPQEIDRVRWCGSDVWDLVYNTEGIFFSEAEIRFKHTSTGFPLVETKGEAENLIKALQKAIELGWVE